MSIEWDVNYLAVVVAALAGMVIGAAYFMPALAGRAWMKSIGKTAEDLSGANQPVLYVFAAIFQLLIATTVAAAIGWADAHTIGGGILVAAILWLGLGAPIVALTLLFELRTVANHVIVALHTLIALVVMGAIIGVWPVSGAGG